MLGPPPKKIRRVPRALVLRRPRQFQQPQSRSRQVYSVTARHQREPVKQVTDVLRSQPPRAAWAPGPVPVPELRRRRPPRRVAWASGLLKL